MRVNTQTKKKITIKFQNGLNFTDFNKDVFEVEDLVDVFEFEESENPEFIIFGPYGNDIPKKSERYTRIGYFCENITPDFSCCEWAFGIPLETEINHSNYKRIQWHGLDVNKLIRNLSENDIDKILSSKTKFCNFLYSNEVPYREEFFKQLSKYKKVDAPGKSMHNMPSIDKLYEGTIWERKRKFLADYKFTIAFENYSYPGYQTEKLYDAMQMNSIPIYCGDPNINEIFNSKSLLNTHDYVSFNYSKSIQLLEKISQPNFKDYRPQFFNNVDTKISRKLKSLGRKLKMELQFNNLDFSNLIDQIIEIDTHPDKYLKLLRTPWFVGNEIPLTLSTKRTWEKIFNGN